MIMKTAIEDSRLMAFLDGELDSPATREVEALMAEDPELAAKVRELREADSLVRSAFNQVMTEFPETETPAPPPLAARRPTGNSRRWGPVTLAVAASMTVLLIGGAIGFAMLESLVAQEFDRREQLRELDRSTISQTLSDMLENELSGTAVSWHNAESGNSGMVVPIQTWRTKAGQYCREFKETNILNGTESVEHGVACRTPQGSWKVRMRYYPDPGSGLLPP